ncbi:hypothetical protein KXD93_12175 [Mucilaginibacter sp. BJC16-A38]|uniref:hypothetical protein n=1 Tax=Mucilaginibacter phenanthrenivorans TaxID=1234842 RepID=UPI002158294D|nr:hypothetical protein [Mucilaginibacter phenanthrenivorans]MCR8558407.1 hypothetical protein [Mucilaginibacter phenanthrenivorans]
MSDPHVIARNEATSAQDNQWTFMLMEPCTRIPVTTMAFYSGACTAQRLLRSRLRATSLAMT